MTKIVHIDIETTGLNYENDQILQFAAIIDDFKSPVNKLPVFNVLVKQKRYSGSAFALSMNSWILRATAGVDQSDYRIVNNWEVTDAFYFFLISNGFESDNNGKVKIQVAGKNAASFDIPFIKRLPKFTKNITIMSRALDIGNLYFDPTKDETIPNLSECKARAGLPDYVSHDSQDDAMDTLMLTRIKYGLPTNSHKETA